MASLVTTTVAGTLTTTDTIQIQSVNPIIQLYDSNDNTNSVQAELNGGIFRLYKYTGSTNASHAEIFKLTTAGVVTLAGALTGTSATFSANSTLNGLRVGEWQGGSSYKGIFHQNHTADEYCLISNDGPTYISATTGQPVYIRGGNNVSTYQVVVSHNAKATASGYEILTTNTGLELSGGTLTGALTGTSATFSGNLDVTGGLVVDGASTLGDSNDTTHVKGSLVVDTNIYGPSLGAVAIAAGLNVTGATTISTSLKAATILDAANSAGTSNQVLTSTGSALDWKTLSEISGVDGSGTASYIPKWTDTDTIGNSIIYDSGASVGISSVAFTSPVGTLHTQAVGSNTTNLDAYSTTNGNNSSINFRKSDSDTAGTQTETDSGDSLGGLGFYGVNTGGGWGIGAAILVSQEGASGATYIPSHIAFATCTASAYAEQMRIASGGKVGIGTNNPAYSLDIRQAAGDVYVQSSTGTNRAGFQTSNTGGTSYFYRDSSTGQAIFSGSSAYATVVGGSGARSLHLGTNNNVRMTIDSAGLATFKGSLTVEGTDTNIENLYVNQEAIFDGHAYPYADSSYTLGTSALRWSTIYGDAGNFNGPLTVTKSSGLAPLTLVSNPANQVADIGGEIIFQATYRATSDTTPVARIKGSRENATTNNWAGKLTFHTSPGGDSPSASTEQMRITSAGKVGIGTNAPDMPLVVKTTAAIQTMKLNGHHTGYGSSLQFDATDAGGLNFELVSGGSGTGGSMNSKFSIRDVANNAPRLTIDSVGNVGIGIATPSERLHIAESTSGSASIRITNSTTGTGSSSGLRVSLEADENTTIMNHSNTNLNLGVNGLNVISIKDAKVGIGVTAPVAKLHIDDSATGDNKGLYIQNTHNTDGDSAAIRFGFAGNDNANKGGIFFKRTANYGRGSLIFATENNQTNDNVDASDAKLTILADGKVGIGTTAPASSLHVDGDDTITVGSAGGNSTGYLVGTSSPSYTNQPGTNLILKGGDGSGTGSSYMAFYTSPSGSAGTTVNTSVERMRILNDGKVGIGTDSPSAALDVVVSSDVWAAEINQANASNGDGLYVNTGSTASADYVVSFRANNANVFDVKANGHVGIGEATPSHLLHIRKDQNAKTSLLIDNRNGGTGASASIFLGSNYTTEQMDIRAFGSAFTTSGADRAGGGLVRNSQSGGLSIVASNAAGETRFYTAGSADGNERMVIKADGKVGINVNDPDSSLEIKGAGATTGLTFKTTDSSGNTGFWAMDGGRVGVHYFPFLINQDHDDTNYPAACLMYAHSATPFTIKTDGKVGIGTTAPGANFEILKNGAFASGQSVAIQMASALQAFGGNNDMRLYFHEGGTTYRGMMGYAHAGSTYMGIWDSGSNLNPTLVCQTGKVGIGTTAPGARLELSQADASAGLQMLRIRNFATSATGTFTGDYVAEIRSAYTSAATKGALLVHTQEASDSRPVMAVSDSNGIFTTFVNGKVGIGTAVPATPLHIYSTANDVLKIQGADHARVLIDGTAASEKSLNFTEAGALKWKVGMDNVAPTANFVIKNNDDGAAQFVIDYNTGDVGIGVVPTAVNTSHKSLQIGGNVNIQSYGTKGAGGEVDFCHNVYLNQDGNYKLISADEGTMYRQGSGKHYFYSWASGTANSNVSANAAALKLVIAADGNVGINTTSPDRTLDVTGTGRFTSNVDFGASIYVSSGGHVFLDGGSDTYITEVASNQVAIFTGGHERFRINASGDTTFSGDVKAAQFYTGYDWTTRSGGLNIGSQGITTGAVTFYDGVLASSASIYRDSSSVFFVGARGGVATTGMAIDTNGNVGIGDSTPNYKLDVNGTFRVTGAATFDSSVTASTFSGNGASISALNALNISSGTVGTARLGSGTANSSTFLRGDYTWATPANTTYSAGTGLTLSSTTFATKLDELTDMTADIVGSQDELILLDNGSDRRKQINEIKLGQFNNDQGWTSNAGDITAVGAALGLSGGGTSGSVSLALDLNELSSLNAPIGTDKMVFVDGTASASYTIDDVPLSIFDNDSGWTSNTGDITNVTAGTTLSGGGSSGSVTINHASHTGEVTGSGSLTIANNVVDEANLKVSNSPTNGYVLTARSGNTGGMTWEAASGGGGDTVSITASADDILSVSSGAISGVAAGSSDKIVFWDNSQNKLTYLAASTGLYTSGTNFKVTSDVLMKIQDTNYNYCTPASNEVGFYQGGSITVFASGSGVTFSDSSSSDYRLKSNISTFNSEAWTKVKSVNLRRFDFDEGLLNPKLSTITNKVGFIAHELAEAGIEGAVEGTKDEVDADGNPVYQKVCHSKLIPVMWGALKEAISKIETLETKVQTLENS